MKIVILGLSITSSWGNGHATTYRSLMKALCERGHDVLFLERDKPWYAENRDLPDPPFGRTYLYSSVENLRARFDEEIQAADMVVVGSYVPEGVDIGTYVIQNAGGISAFYDIDTPITLAKVSRNACESINSRLIASYDLYLSFTGGKVLNIIEQDYGGALVRPLYCSVDPELYFSQPLPISYDLGYLGTYSIDRQSTLDGLLVNIANELTDKRFVVAGPSYPDAIRWPKNVERIEHLPPAEHCRFDNEQRFTLNITRSEMIRVGYAPSVRLFEAAACGVPIISDWWPGLDAFFKPGEEILIARGGHDSIRILTELSESERLNLGTAARRTVLENHTSTCRAIDLEDAYATAKKHCLKSRSTSAVPTVESVFPH